MNTYTDLKVPALKKLANRELGLKYSQLDKMKKAEILEAFVASQEEKEKPKESVVDIAAKVIKESEEVRSLTPRQSLIQDVDQYLNKGGEVTQCKAQQNLARTAPTEHSAECNVHLRSAKPKAPGKKKEKAKTQKADKVTNPDVITLQALVEAAGITGAQARKKLRASEIKKPGKQWAWEKGDKQIKEVTKLLSK